MRRVRVVSSVQSRFLQDKWNAAGRVMKHCPAAALSPAHFGPLVSPQAAAAAPPVPPPLQRAGLAGMAAFPDVAITPMCDRLYHARSLTAGLCECFETTAHELRMRAGERHDQSPLRMVFLAATPLLSAYRATSRAWSSFRNARRAAVAAAGSCPRAPHTCSSHCRPAAMSNERLGLSFVPTNNKTTRFCSEN